MRNFSLAALSILVCLWPAVSRAQLKVVLSAERSSYLLYESVPLSIMVTNISDEPVILKNDGGNSWLTFVIQAADRRKIRAESPIETETIVLQPGASRVVTQDITPHYAIRQTGQYFVQASIELPGRKSYLTDHLVLNVGKGEVTWSKTYVDGGAQRVVSLVRYIDLKDAWLFLRVEEPRENLVYATVKLGKVIAYTNPEARIDSFRNIHILHPVGARTFRYTQTDQNGQIIRQEDREVDANPPALRVRDDGRVEFVGGKKMTPETTRPKLSDLQQGL